MANNSNNTTPEENVAASGGTTAASQGADHGYKPITELQDRRGDTDDSGSPDHTPDNNPPADGSGDGGNGNGADGDADAGNPPMNGGSGSGPGPVGEADDGGGLLEAVTDVIGGGDGDSGLLDPVTGLIDGILPGGGGLLDSVGGGSASGSDILDQAIGPVGATGGSIVDDAGDVLQTVGNTVGLPGTVDGLVSVIDSLGIADIGSHDGDGLLADVINLPHDILTGDDPVEAVSDIIDDVGTTVGSVADVPAALLDDLGSPLLNGSVFGDGDPSGSNIVNASVGPQQDNGILLDVLTQSGSSSGNAADVNIGDGEQLVNADVLNGESGLIFPSLGGAGLDSLTGLLDGDTTADAGANADASASLPIVDDVLASLEVDGLLDINSSSAQQQNGSLLNGLI